ncbi:MAG: hypothetical protein OK457_11785, partial [Thaumarchaeota archaeon]|nr:hypothetical protein [Nitrososphaerota archaeon]
MKRKVAKKSCLGKKALRVLRLVRDSVHSTTALGRISEKEGSNPYKVLISTILSARTRDPVTDKASERLFLKFPNVQALASANTADVAQLIYPVSFYNQKAKHIVAASNQLLDEFKGQVPDNYTDL